jgi:hypothetical protein
LTAANHTHLPQAAIDARQCSVERGVGGRKRGLDARDLKNENTRNIWAA